MNLLLWLVVWVTEALLIVAILILLEWLRAKRGRMSQSTEFRFGVYRDDPPNEEDG